MNAFIDSNGVLTCWGYAESNNDDTLVEVEDGFVMPPGSAQYVNGQWEVYVAPITAQSAAAAALTSGLSVTSKGTPALNGTYAIDQLSQMDIIAIETSINAGKGLPGGGATFSYPDVSGVMHSFTQGNFTDFAAAVRDYVYALKAVIAGGTVSLPLASAMIA